MLRFLIFVFYIWGPIYLITSVIIRVRSVSTIDTHRPVRGRLLHDVTRLETRPQVFLSIRGCKLVLLRMRTRLSKAVSCAMRVRNKSRFSVSISIK